MKRLLYFLLVIPILFCSCKGDKGDPGDSTQWHVEELVVGTDDSPWDYSQGSNDPAVNNNYYFAGFNVPALTSSIYLNGNITCYVIFNYDLPSEESHPLPYVRHIETPVTNADGSTSLVYYTETLDYVFGSGWVEFQFRASDFAYESDAQITPPVCHFRMVLTW